MWVRGGDSPKMEAGTLKMTLDSTILLSFGLRVTRTGRGGRPRVPQTTSSRAFMVPQPYGYDFFHASPCTDQFIKYSMTIM